MNKNAIILISLGAVAFLTALYLINKTNDPQPQPQPVDQTENVDNETISLEDAMKRIPDESIRGGINQNEVVYQITSGEASYGANKQFLGKDAENVMGTTQDVQGNGYWNKDTNEVDASIAVNLEALKTDNAKRDADIQPLFTNKIATFRLEPTKVDVQMGQDFETDMTGLMTINGTSQQVTFRVKGNVTDANFNIEGNGSIKMSEFGIQAPSMAGVFTVADEIPVTFKVSGEALAPRPAME